MQLRLTRMTLTFYPPAFAFGVLGLQLCGTGPGVSCMWYWGCTQGFTPVR